MRWAIAAISVAATTVLVAAWLGRPSPLSIAPSVGGGHEATDISLERVECAIRQLGGADSRVTGSAGERAAVEWILAELAGAGIADVEVQEFDVAAPVTADARLEAQSADGATTSIPIFPLWPNLARTSQTDPAGVAGPLVDAGRGTDADIAGKQLRGAIVVIDWDCRDEWRCAPEFGAKVVVFRGARPSDGATARGKFLTVPGAIPRFYVRAADTPALDALLAAQPTTATVRCAQEWRRVRSRNILARVPTVANGLAGAAANPPVIFHAYYDSVSVVPDLAPGAEQACGAATLMELGRFLKGRQTARPVYLLFTGAHGQALTGMTHFVRALKDGLDSGWQDRPGSLMARMGPPGLLVGLDLSSHGDSFGIFCCGRFRGEGENLLRSKFSTLALKLSEYAKSLAPDAVAAGAPPGFVDCINLTLGRGWWTYFPYQAPFESEIPNLAAFPGVTLGTLNDARRYVDTPDDTIDNLALETLGRQLLGQPGWRAGLANIALALAMWDGPFVSSPLLPKLARLRGRVVWLDQERDYVANEPLDGAIVCLKTQRGDKELCGTRGAPLVMTNPNGEFEFDGLIDITGNAQFANCFVESYGAATRAFAEANSRAFDDYRVALAGGKRAIAPPEVPFDGSIVYAQDMAREREYPWRMIMRKADESLNLVCFPCRSVTLYGLTDPREYIDLSHVQILDAGTQSPPFQFGQSVTDASATNVDENCATLWADPSLRVRLTFGFGFQKKRFVLLNNSDADPIGTGYALGQLDSIPSMILEGARDMARLDAWRLERLETHGVNNPRVRQLHQEARANLDAAQTGLTRLDYHAYRVASERAWALESKAYSELLSMTNNMIRGVLFYLALLLPFAYCMERLLLAGATIHRRIAGMVAIFGASFALLAAVHPAFRFTLTPFLVLEAFVILALAGAVCLLVVSKFDRMMQERKQADTGMHEEASNVGGVTTRAVDLGIANIRRRRQRGMLTAMTIIMVMFTLLSFVSIVPELNISKLRYPEGAPAYRGLLTRDRKWQPLRKPVYESIQRNAAGVGAAAPAGPRAIVAGRAWFFSDLKGDLSQIDISAPTDAAGGRFTAVALLCMEATEPAVSGVDRALVAGRWFEDRDETGVILPVHVAAQLGYGAGDLGRPVTVFGRPLPLIGLVDEARFDAIEDLDGEPLTPVNFVLQNQLVAAGPGGEGDVDTLETYVHYATDQVAIVPLEYGLRLGATLRSVAARALPGTDPIVEAEGFARRSNQTILASDGEAVTLFASIAGSRLSAASQIIVPLFLGFLMALGTMLGAVYERRKEIFIYNSVGLSPRHVASLFLAEASVYAIVGACAGFLLGQIVSKLLLMTGALSGLTLNYSAGSTVFVTALTMAIVLGSTLYPARQAFRAAIPESHAGENELGAEDFSAGRLSFFLPFVTTPAHVYAMQAYMNEFLDGVQGVTVGQLAVDNLLAVGETVEGRPAPTLRFRAWLAPFDLGISHDTELRVIYRPERGVYQYHLTAVRFSGDQQSWRRLTPRFVQALRKQLLMWRIIPSEAQTRYDETGRRLFGAEQV